MLEEIREYVDAAELILVGIGEEFSIKQAGREQVIEAYETLAGLLKGKGYFIVTLQADDLIYESRLAKERIVAPCGSDVQSAFSHSRTFGSRPLSRPPW